MDAPQETIDGITVSFGRMTIRFSGEYEGRIFCYFRGADVVTFGTVDGGNFKMESVSKHQELIKSCEQKLQISGVYASIRESTSQMSRQETSIPTSRLQRKNKGAAIGSKGARKRK